MKVRSDSAFAKLTKTQALSLLHASKSNTLEMMVEVVKGAPEPIHCSIPAMKKFLRRVAEAQMVDETLEAEEAVQALAKKAESTAVREATLAAVQQKMFDEALQSDDRELLMKLYQSLNEERTQERKIKIAEENAKLGWRKLECENARAGLKLLPKVQAILMDAQRDPTERLNEALSCLWKEGGGLLSPGAVNNGALAVTDKKEAGATSD